MVSLALLCAAPPNLDAVLDAPALRGAAYSVYVCTLDGKKLYGRNETVRLVPASNEKLFTGAFALNTLGPDYRPTTSIWTLDNVTLVQSSGDPGMTYDQLLKAKTDLKLTGQKPVKIFEAYRPGIPPSWEYDDLPNKYAASITAFTVDKGAFELWGDGPSVFFQPAAYGNRATRESSAGNSRVEFDLFGKQARVFGDPPKTKSRLDTLSIPDPDIAAASILGAPVDRTLELPSLANSNPPYKIVGRSVGDLLRECLTRSDNMLAESLLLMAAGSKESLLTDPYGVAQRQIKAFLTGVVGVDEPDVRPYDGSGLSRHNMLTTRAISKVLIWERKQPTADLWLDCLASAGAGTLKDRLQKTTFKGKTGTMDGVVSLSGYLKTADGQEIIMSFVVNQALSGAKAVREVQDAVVRALESSNLSEITDSTPVASERSRG